MPTSVWVLSLLWSCAPLGCFLLFRAWLGRHDREPHAVVLLCFLWGAVGGAFVGLTGAGLLSGALSHLRASPFLDVLAAVPLSEELGKGLVLLLLWSRIDSSAAGLFYGASSGLGFVMTENLWYFLHAFADAGREGWQNSIFVRTLFSACIHTAATATFGFFLGRLRDAPRRRRLLGVLVGYLCSVTIHALWNGTLYVGQAERDLFLSVRLFARVPLVMAGLLLLFEVALRAESRVLLRELTAEAQAGRLDPAHPPILADYRRRRGAAWLPAQLRPGRAAYVRALLSLALSRHRERQRLAA